MSLESTFKLIQAEQDLQRAHHVAKELRDFLAGALCAHCGDPLGHDEEIATDGEKTFHKKCEVKDELG